MFRILFVVPRRKHSIDEDWLDALSRHFQVQAFSYSNPFELSKLRNEEYDYVVVQPSFLRAMLLKNMYNLIVLDHGVFGMNFTLDMDIVKSFKSYVLHILSRKMVFNSRLIALSNYQRYIFLSLFKKDAYVVPNPIRYVQAKPFPSTDRIRAIVVSKAHRIKGTHILIQALKLLERKLPGNFELVVVGNFRKDTFSEFTFVRYLGRLSRKDTLEAISNSHFLIFPSLSETFGLPVAEAMALKRPVITTRCGGVEDFFDERFGMYVQKNPIDLAKGILHMIENFHTYDIDTARKHIYEHAGYESFARKFRRVLE